MPDIDPSAQYYINPLTQPDVSITIDVEQEGTLSGQSNDLDPLIFTITTSVHDATKTNLCTTYQGGSYCLDQWGDNVTQVAFQKAGYDSGQEWTLTSSIDSSDGSTIWRMQTEFAGPNRFLAVDTDGANLIMSSNSPRDATEWKIVDIRSTSALISTTSTTTTIQATSTSSIAASTVTTSIHHSPSASTSISSDSTSNLASGIASPDNPTKSSALSTGAIVGIVIGVVFLIAMLVAAYFFVWRRKQKRYEPVVQPGPAPSYMTPYYQPQMSDGKRIVQPELAEVSAEQHGSYEPWSTVSTGRATIATSTKPSETIYHELGGS